MGGRRYVEVHPDTGSPATGAIEEEQRLERLQHVYTDLSRMQRRMEEERCQARLALLEPLLAMMEDLRRTVRDGAVDAAELRATLNGILDRLAALMEAQGVERIPSVGRPFDPEVHEAVIAEQRGEYSEWRVVEELEVGYRFRERLIRPSKVRVVR